MATFFSAKNGKIRVGAGALTITAKSWTVTPQVDELDTTNTEGAGFYECIGGIEKATITIEFDSDAAQQHFTLATSAANTGLRPGTRCVNLTLYWQNTAGPNWLFPIALVTTTPNMSNVKEANKNTVTLVGSGTFTYPTGTFTPV
jgi:hypothetical protein